MERRFSMNDFEESLKEHADDFKMIPSKRVWHGIYNDLHPGRRWPSVAMSFLLIFTLVVVGHLNTHTGSQVHNISKDYFSSQNKNLKTRSLPSNNHSNISNASGFKNAGNSTLSQQIVADKLKPESSSNSNTTNTNHSYIAANTSPKKAQIFNKAGLEPANNVTTISQDNEVKSQQNINIKPTLVESNDYHAELNSKTNISNYNNLNIDYPQKDIDLNSVYTIKPDIQVYKSESILSADKSSSTSSVTDSKNLSNKLQSAETKNVAKIHHKKNAKISWGFYAAPDVNSVTFSGQPIKPITNPGSSPAVAINQKENRVIYNPSLGFEAGTQFNYEISKKLSFTLGLQVTYSGYRIISNQVHPTLSTLMLKDSKTGVIYAKNYLTHYGDGTGLSAVPLRNYSLQASLPLGLQYELFGNKKLQFNAAANFAPSLILKSNAYLLSSDGSNYINDPSLLRKWNMSSNFGLFVTFHSNKLKWQVGPNVRYQWLSTYKPDYTIKEHLIDYGLRIGISK